MPRTRYEDLPEPQAQPCPLRPEVVARFKETVEITNALWKTSEEYHAGAITYSEFGRRNRETWDRAERSGVIADVRRRLRNA